MALVVLNVIVVAPDVGIGVGLGRMESEYEVKRMELGGWMWEDRVGRMEVGAWSLRMEGEVEK